MKRTVLAITLLLTLLPASRAAEPEDSLFVEEVKREPVRVFMPKGDVSAGIQFFYLNLGSSNSEIALFLQHLDANGDITSISPYFDYTYKDNKSIGFRTKYANVSGGVANADLSLLSDGMEMSLQDINASSRSLQTELYHRSYAALDERGRFGVYVDLALQWARTDTAFSYNSESLDTSSATRKIGLAVHPGLMIFVLNNLSTHVSIGIGGAHLTRTDYLKNGETIGTRYYSKVNFMLDILDISYGLSLHF